jgi:ribosomal protein S18 acetylase RimI-like enzyme
MLQDFVVIDYTQKMVILAVLGESGKETIVGTGKETIVGTGKETIVGIGQYDINRDMHTADIALAVRDKCQNQGLGTVLITYLTHLAKRKGLLGFTAEVLVGNDPVFRLFDRMGFDVHKRNESGIYEMKLLFKDIDQN